ncbi:MAG: phosphohistidine phosphatase SixA [Candidatus Glassbacteria bacterium RIFCSPLOWO2_12_FULL_58_11]|uniref:Phosphohistidine phosphatase SixA n=1 Tax=Candidatus Glassbacteria bacterium RIFCSPLOWO2_12_FULL_58_11 TaxID=1817867 RepID=A0A1F5YJW4_9BACT|nr:MAG: phosphohistidine phosphatase SixA [Candidatus Glassbacteria bacterium RIFCSPLOWO2_12_FULL_58_11]
MKVYLVRHGKALPPELDRSQPLSEEGRTEISHVARTLQNMNLSLGCIFHSGKLRAEETAVLIGDALQPAEGVRAVGGLKPNDEPAEALELISAAESDLMLVSHLPLLDRILSALVGPAEREEWPTFECGSLVGVERIGDRWQIFRQLGPSMIY